jgi:hypothetical protein
MYSFQTIYFLKPTILPILPVREEAAQRGAAKERARVGAQVRHQQAKCEFRGK